MALAALLGAQLPTCSLLRTDFRLHRHASIVMGVSDRMANDGLLYDGWGKEGMRVLNRTATLQQLAEDRGISRYDTCLIVAVRAKEKAYASAEEPGGYLGSSFGGPMGSGMRKPKPAKSQVVAAVEELLEEVDMVGEFPQLVTPGIPPELEEQWLREEEEEAAARAAEALSTEDAAEAAAAVSAMELGELFSDALDGVLDEDDDAREVAEDDEDDPLAALLDGEDDGEDDDFDDDLDALLGDDDSLADIFGALTGSGDGGVEASGMSPGDSG